MAADGSSKNKTIRKARKVLLVDDSEEIRRTLLLALSEWGYEGRAVASLSDARATLAEWHPDLVLLDVLLPDGSTVDLARELGVMSPAPAIVAITGAATRSEAFELAQHGVRRLVNKPFRQESLREVIEEALSERSSLSAHVRQTVPGVSLKQLVRDVRNAAVDQALSLAGGNHSEAARMLEISRQGLQRRVKDLEDSRPPARHSPRTAVVADDDAGIRSLLRGWLDELGFLVDEARDGEELLRKAQPIALAWPTLLVVDYQMPRLSGSEALQRLRSEGCQSPAILVSGLARAHVEDETAPSVLLLKPIRAEEFQRVVRELVPAVGEGQST